MCRENRDADVAALVATDVRLPFLHPRQVVDVVERVALGPADHDVAVRDDVLAEHAVDEDRGVHVLDGTVRPQQVPHLVLELVEEDLGDEVVVLPGHAVGVGGVDAEHLGRHPEEAAAVHSLVVLLRHERGPHRLVLRLPRQRRDDPAHPVVDDRFRAEDRPEDTLHGLLLGARQLPEALGVGGEIDAVGVPGVDVRRREDVREGPPAAGDLPVGGLVIGDQRLDLVQEPTDLGARCANGPVLGGQVRGDVHVATVRRGAASLGGGPAAWAGPPEGRPTSASR